MLHDVLLRVVARIARCAFAVGIGFLGYAACLAQQLAPSKHLSTEIIAASALQSNVMLVDKRGCAWMYRHGIADPAPTLYELPNNSSCVDASILPSGYIVRVTSTGSAILCGSQNSCHTIVGAEVRSLMRLREGILVGLTSTNSLVMLDERAQRWVPILEGESTQIILLAQSDPSNHVLDGLGRLGVLSYNSQLDTVKVTWEQQISVSSVNALSVSPSTRSIVLSSPSTLTESEHRLYARQHPSDSYELVLMTTGEVATATDDSCMIVASGHRIKRVSANGAIINVSESSIEDEPGVSAHGMLPVDDSVWIFGASGRTSVFHADSIVTVSYIPTIPEAGFEIIRRTDGRPQGLRTSRRVLLGVKSSISLEPLPQLDSCTTSRNITSIAVISDSLVYIPYQSSYNHKRVNLNSSEYWCIRSTYRPDRVLSTETEHAFGVDSWTRMISHTNDGWASIDTIRRLTAQPDTVLGIGHIMSNGTDWYVTGVIQRAPLPGEALNRSAIVWRIDDNGNVEVFRSNDYHTITSANLRGSVLSMIVQSNKNTDNRRTRLITVDLETGNETTWFTSSSNEDDQLSFAAKLPHGGYLVGRLNGLLSIIRTPSATPENIAVPTELPGLMFRDCSTINDSTVLLVTNWPVSSATIVSLPQLSTSVNEVDPYRALKLVDIVSVSPNPARDNVKVRFIVASGIGFEGAQWSIIDALGASILCGQLDPSASNGATPGEWQTEINTSSLHAGAYSLCLSLTGYRARSSLIIAR